MEKDSKNDLIQALRAGAQGTARSKAARLREIIDEVEAAKKSGLGHKQIVAILESRGLSFTLGSFEITLHRIQKNRGNTGKAKKPQLGLEVAYPEVKTAVAVPVAPEAPAAVTPSASTKLDLVRPPGITDAKWSEMRAKARANNRKQLK